ncbi:MAG: hypothetical protein KC643_06665 [Nitrospira sp.]|nr:hypothetical protein [Nitrospira sp.]
MKREIVRTFYRIIPKPAAAFPQCHPLGKVYLYIRRHPDAQRETEQRTELQSDGAQFVQPA